MAVFVAFSISFTGLPFEVFTRIASCLVSGCFKTTPANYTEGSLSISYCTM